MENYHLISFTDSLSKDKADAVRRLIDLMTVKLRIHHLSEIPLTEDKIVLENQSSDGVFFYVNVSDLHIINEYLMKFGLPNKKLETYSDISDHLMLCSNNTLVNIYRDCFKPYEQKEPLYGSYGQKLCSIL